MSPGVGYTDIIRQLKDICDASSHTNSELSCWIHPARTCLIRKCIGTMHLGSSEHLPIWLWYVQAAKDSLLLVQYAFPEHRAPVDTQPPLHCLHYTAAYLTAPSCCMHRRTSLSVCSTSATVCCSSQVLWPRKGGILQQQLTPEETPLQRTYGPTTPGRQHVK